MKIRIAALSPGHNEIVESLPPGDLELDPETYRSPIEATVMAEKAGGRISLHIDVYGEGDYFCDRCGDDFVMDVGGELDLVFIQRDEPLPGEAPGDELRSFREMQDELDISADVRDALMLSLPLKLLCSEDCRGLCPKCGANLNREACRCK